ncbi:MAG: hypothetical protein IIB57_11450 [Planctomycetes bacterium]|nr:hypothetical protein [Planctomycetota bacterium]
MRLQACNVWKRMKVTLLTGLTAGVVLAFACTVTDVRHNGRVAQILLEPGFSIGFTAEDSFVLEQTEESTTHVCKDVGHPSCVINVGRAFQSVFLTDWKVGSTFA